MMVPPHWVGRTQIDIEIWLIYERQDCIPIDTHVRSSTGQYEALVFEAWTKQCIAIYRCLHLIRAIIGDQIIVPREVTQ